MIDTALPAPTLVAAALRTPTQLTILYDERCALCHRCRAWLETQSTHPQLVFLAAGSPAARVHAELLPWLGNELIVVSERGEVWVGASAFLMCLWATRRYREWSYRLSSPSFAPLAERFFHLVSSRRKTIGRLLPATRKTPPCPDGRCRHRDR